MGVFFYLSLLLQADIWRRHGLCAKIPGCPQAKRHWSCRSSLLHQPPGVCHLPAEVCASCSPPVPPHLLFPVREGGLLAQQTLRSVPARNSRRLPWAACSAPTWRTESSRCRSESNGRDGRRLWWLCVVLWRAQWLVAVWREDQSWAGGGLQ